VNEWMNGGIPLKLITINH